jgi:hypothetical protein
MLEVTGPMNGGRVPVQDRALSVIPGERFHGCLLGQAVGDALGAPYEGLPGLVEAGCADEDLLSHCRGPGPHARGCWAVDLLLGKR